MRGARIAAAAAAGPFDVTVVLGGERPDGIRFGAARVMELPPLKAGPAGFSALVTPDGRPLDESLKAERRDRLLEAFAQVDPDILLIEAYPFGRRPMRFELLPLLQAAHAQDARPMVAASIRDILQEGRAPERDAETVSLVRRFFDHVLVHGDPAVVSLGDSFPLAASIEDRLIYTGLVGPGPSGAAPPEIFDVIVSVGGGAVGAALIEAAIAAQPLTRLAAAPWLILGGPNLPPDRVPDSRQGITVRPFVADLPERLRRARLSVSQAGYNTVADLLTAPECRAVLVPYVGSGETEQSRRAALMEEAGLAVALAPDALDPATLAAKIDEALDRPAPAHPMGTAPLDGAARTARALDEAFARHRGLA